MNNPPSLPTEDFPQDRDTWFHKAANYAVSAPLFTMGAGLLLGATAVPDPAKRIIGLAGGIALLTAIPAGIVALIGISRHGPARLLWKGLIGLGVSVLCIAMAIPAVLKVRQNALANGFAQGVNSKAPRMIDQVTRLDRAQARGDGAVVIYETILSFEVTDANRSAWRVKVRPALRAQVEKSETMNAVRKGLPVIFNFSDKNGAFINEVGFGPEDYPPNGAVPKAGDAKR